MAMLSISTKTGDKGESGLANGQRLPKSALIFEVLGTQDEVNSWLGLVIAKLDDQFAPHRTYLLELQDTLFYVGAELAQSPKAKLSPAKLKKLEKKSDQLQNSMAEGWTTQFIYPGGTEVAALVDLARAISRRFERLVVRYSETMPVSGTVLKFINRLSDYLFVLRCFINQRQSYKEKKFTSKATYANQLRQKVR